MTEMKRFIVKLALFGAAGVALLAAFSMAERHGVARAMNGSLFRLPTGVTTIIAGDSHPKTSLDPEFIPGSINISMDAENYVFTYYKLRHFLTLNPQITTVILGFSDHNLSKLFPESTLNDFGGCDSYYLFLDQEGKGQINRSHLVFRLAALKYDLGIPINIYRNSFMWKAAAGRTLQPADFPAYGGFYSTSRSNLNDRNLAETLQRHYFDARHQYAGTSKVNIRYLVKIADLCSKGRVRLVLFVSPEHVRYRNGMPPEATAYYEAVKAELLRRQNVLLADLRTLPLHDEAFGDGDHVNTIGAATVSAKVAQLLQKRHSDQ